MEISLLGPPQVSIAGRPIGLGARKQRFLLAVLALEANHQVSTERIIDLMWPQEPPPTSRGMIHTYVSGLRRLLDDAGVRLERQESGYVLRCDSECVDAHRFHRLIAAARDSPDDVERVALLGQALALWRGPALAGVAAEEVRTRLARTLEEARLTAIEDRVETLMRLGRHDGLLAELLKLDDGQPMRPRIVQALMRELHRLGRTAEALEFFRHYQARVRDELGLDPPEQVQRLHSAILRNDPAAATLIAPPVLSAPRQLPGDLPTFTGRATELAELLGVFRAAPGSAATVVITAIDGMAGIGKTVLAVHAAHRLADLFADGQLFVDLHGFTHAVRPVDPADALVQLLQGLGVSGQQMPPSLDARAALYRSLLADKHMLIVLDNAVDEDQVQPLLPGAQGCAVLVTSRNRLAGLPHARPLSLDLLPAADAQTLFVGIAGNRHRPEAVNEIIQLCGRLPLAVRIAAARLRSRATWTADHLAQRLRDGRSRLAELGTDHLGVATAIDLSYRQLGPDTQRLYRMLGLHPGADIDAHAAAALVADDPFTVGQWLEGLVDAHLLQSPHPGRYQQHDLVRAHAFETVNHHEAAAERDRALARLLDYYAHTASAAMSVAYPYDASQTLSPPAPDMPSPLFDERGSAASWLDEELANLLACAGSGRAIDLSAALHNHLRARGRYAQAEWLHGRAIELARELGDVAREARSLNCLGGIQNLQGRYEPATDCFERAFELASRIGDAGQQAEATWGLGYLNYMNGRHRQAGVHYRLALRLARKQGDVVREIHALRGLGHVNYSEADYTSAEKYFDDALRISRRIGHHVVEMDALRGLGIVNLARGQHDSSARYFEQNLRIAREVGHVHGQLAALRGLAHALRLKGNLDSAAEFYRQSLELARTIGDPNSQFEATLGLGSCYLAAGCLDQALARYETAFSLARTLAHRDDEARSCDGLAHTHLALGRLHEARQYWAQALTILNELNIRQAEETDDQSIRRQLNLLAANEEPPNAERS